MMKLFIQFEISKLIKFFKTKTLAKLITSSLFIAVFVLLGLGIYGFFLSGFRFINIEATDDIRHALTLFLYEVFLIVLTLVIVFSGIVSGLFGMFTGTKNTWLVSTPSFKLFPFIILLRSTVTSFLPSLIMFLPAILAFNKVYKVGPASIAAITLSVFLTIITINTLTLSALLVVGTLYRIASSKIKELRYSFGGFIALLGVIGATSMFIIWKNIKEIDLVVLFKADADTTVLSVANISEHFSFIPTHPFALQLLHWQTNNTDKAITALLWLLLITTLSTILFRITAKLYYPLWQRFQEGGQRLQSSHSENIQGYTFSGGSAVALFKKEMLIASRNYKGMLWFLFLSSIWLMEIGANVILGKNVARSLTDISQKTNVLETIQYVIAIYFISAFTLRFVFPSFSMEKRTSWILGSAPLHIKTIFYGKLAFFSLFFVTIGIIMSNINAYVLGLSLSKTLDVTALLVTTTLFIITLGLSLGALFPSKESDDPEVITTSMTGLFFTAFALLYGGFSAALLYISLINSTNIPVLAISVVSITLTAIILYETPRYIKNHVD